MVFVSQDVAVAYEVEAQGAHGHSLAVSGPELCGLARDGGGHGRR
jgi:hypothetical protein